MQMKKKYKYPWFKPFINKNIKKNFKKIFDKNQMTMGLKTYELEKKLQKYLRVKHAILTTSGTSAITMASLAIGLKPGDKVIIQNLTWVASINPFLIQNCKIILIDTLKKQEIIDYDKLNKSIKKHKPKLVILVHLNGQAVYNKEFDRLQKKMKFNVIEDAAQSFLVKKSNQKFSGTVYNIGCFSFSISKLINMIYGGLCVTNNSKLAKKLIAIRNNGVNSEPENARLELPTEKGLNFKPSDLHASVALENLKEKSRIFKNSKKIYLFYEKNLKNKKLELVKINIKKFVPVYIQVLVNNRMKFYNYCNKNSVQLHFGIRTLNQGIIDGKKKDLKNSIFLSNNLIRIPCGPSYKLNELKKIVKVLNKY